MLLIFWGVNGGGRGWKLNRLKPLPGVTLSCLTRARMTKLTTWEHRWHPKMFPNGLSRKTGRPWGAEVTFSESSTRPPVHPQGPNWRRRTWLRPLLDLQRHQWVAGSRSLTDWVAQLPRHSPKDPGNEAKHGSDSSSTFTHTKSSPNPFFSKSKWGLYWRTRPSTLTGCYEITTSPGDKQTSPRSRGGVRLPPRWKRAPWKSYSLDDRPAKKIFFWNFHRSHGWNAVAFKLGGILGEGWYYPYLPWPPIGWARWYLDFDFWLWCRLESRKNGLGTRRDTTR